MLRLILQARRKPHEDWLQWMERKAARSKAYYKKMGHRTLLERYLLNLHRYANCVRSSLDQRVPILIADAITWKDTNWWRRQQDDARLLRGDMGRWRHASDWRGIRRKWDMPLEYHYGRAWLHCTSSKDWDSTLTSFIDSAFDMVGCHRSIKEKMESLSTEPVRKKARVVFDLPVLWDKPQNEAVPMEILGDSAVVIAWINGVAHVDTPKYVPQVASLMMHLHTTWMTGAVTVRRKHLSWCRHVYRELNKLADAMATKALETKCRHLEPNDKLMSMKPMFTKAFFDGGRRDSLASFGWVLFGAFSVDAEGQPNWECVCAGADILGDVSTVQAELCGAGVAIEIATAYACGNLNVEEALNSHNRALENVGH